MFATLCYAFWLSFARIGFPSISPHVWPLVWLGLTATILFDPLPFQSRPSRYWILRKLGRLFISGTQRVEVYLFVYFFPPSGSPFLSSQISGLGMFPQQSIFETKDVILLISCSDQLCSLVFTLSNLYLFACLYAEDFNEDWSNCTTQAKTWPIVFLLSALPFIIRLIQSIKRYADSGLATHLINVRTFSLTFIDFGCLLMLIKREENMESVSYIIYFTLYGGIRVSQFFPSVASSINKPDRF